MKNGEARNLTHGSVIVSKYHGHVLIGTFLCVGDNGLLDVKDVITANGERSDVNAFLPMNTNIANPVQYSNYIKILADEHKLPAAKALHEIGGNHYGKLAIEPIEYIEKNHLSFDEGNVIKYVSRHAYKNGAEDIQKAIDYCMRILADKYNIKSHISYESPEMEEHQEDA